MFVQKLSSDKDLTERIRKAAIFTAPKHKPMNFSSTLSALRLLGFLEGCSFLLFALTMPVKYMLDIKWPNMVVGMLHGILFIAYVMFVFMVSKERKWDLKTQFWAYLASLLPFGTFVADAKIFKPEQQKDF
jgi:integral membrane protein